ncbi:MAG: ubiquinone/menaquinone biosynthesis methyltransferase [Anaerolineales bacterium]|nr:ubiquinone/menaquinone biosynthesis methyltransferase [Anaerolineales bacterium]
MFAGIAGRYDVMNRLMTAGQDVKWRKYVIEQAHLPANGRILDIATGTGDIAQEALDQVPDVQAVGGDFTIEMMQVGKQYPERQAIQWVGSDTLALPFISDYFDAVTSGFLMRNVIDVEKALQEQFRILKPGGRIVILESSPPKKNILRPFILIHLNYIIPTLGKLIAGTSEAYTYLPESTKGFRSPEDLAQVMARQGFESVSFKLFMFGTIAVHVGQKPV